MENKQQQILSEMTNLLAALKAQVEELEIKLAEYQQVVDNQQVGELVEEVVETHVQLEVEVADEPVIEEVADAAEEPEVVLEIVESEDEIAEDQQADMFEMEVMDIELEPSDDLPFYDDIPSEEQVSEELPEDPVHDDLPDEPASEFLPEPAVVEDLPEVESAPVAVIDAMTAKQAWRTDMPGTPVKDIRSAISLNDRILFINYLFGEDPIAFQDMLTKLNAMSSFDEAAEYVIAANPDWDLESDTVYRFMMAIRRRLQ